MKFLTNLIEYVGNSITIPSKTGTLAMLDDIITNHAFLESFVTNSTTLAFCQSVASNAVIGRAYAGDLECSDLPGSLAKAECIVTVIKSAVGEEKLLHLQLVSGNTEWIGNYNGTSFSGWQSLVKAGDSISITSGGSLTIGSTSLTEDDLQKLKTLIPVDE